MRALAATLCAAMVVACIWLVRLSQRPVEFSMGERGFIGFRVSALAITVAAIASVVCWSAARRRLGGVAVTSIGVAGLTTAVASAQRPELSEPRVIVTGIAWLAGAAAVGACAIFTSVRFANLPRRPTIVVLVLVAASGSLAAILGGTSALGATIGVAPFDNPSTAARAVLGLHTLTLVAGAASIAVFLWSRRASGTSRQYWTDPVLLSMAAWLVASVIERTIHLFPISSYRDSYLLTYRDGLLFWAVHLPLATTGLVIGAVGWSFMVRPSAERLPSGTLVLPDRDPIAMLRNDLSAWVGDPTLRLAYADGHGGWITSEGEMHLDDVGVDRATTVVTREGRPVGILDHDIELAKAPDALHTAAALAGLAFDANQLLAVSEGRLAEARQLGERLLVVDATTRADVEAELDAGPLGRLQACARDLLYGSSVASIVEPIRQATAEVRLLSHGLYPPELIEGGLSAVVGERRGAPRRRLPAAVEVTAFRLVTDDPDGWFQDRGTMLIVHVRRDTIPASTLDRIDVLGGTVRSDRVELPIEDV